MEIASDPFLSRLAGALAAGIALLQVLLGAFLFPDVLVLCVAAGGAFALLSVACFSYHHVVHIDRDNDVLEQHRRMLFIERNRGFLLSSFKGVGVAAVAGGGGFRPVPLVHLVELRGRTRLILPGFHAGLVQARAKAAGLAAFLDIPLETRVRRIFLDR